MPPTEALLAVHRLLTAQRHGVLSTLHVRHSNWPFGSLTPYALTERHEPIFLFSAIAEHTHNLRADPRASLLVQEATATESPLASARATIMGRVEVLEGAAREQALTIYLARFREAAAWATAHDFHPFVLRVAHVRWIAGFGSRGWIDGDHWV